jgi:hypothetical protein
MQEGRDGFPPPPAAPPVVLDDTRTVSVPFSVSWKVGKECDDNISRTIPQFRSSRLDRRDLNVFIVVKLRVVVLVLLLDVHLVVIFVLMVFVFFYNAGTIFSFWFLFLCGGVDDYALYRVLSLLHGPKAHALIANAN